MIMVIGMEDNSGKKFSLQDWVMKRAANQSGGSLPSQTARQFLSEHAAEDEVQKAKEIESDLSLDVEMKAVSNGSTVLSTSIPASPEDLKGPDPQPAKKEDYTKENPLSSLNGVQNPLQQLQIVRLLTDLGDRLRQSEKEREILWKEVEICRKQISDMNSHVGKNEKSVTDLESQINQREVFVKELVEKQIGLENQLKDQLAALDTSKQEQAKLQEEQAKLQDKLQDKLNSVETAAGSAIVRVEDAIAENTKLSKKVEQLTQDKARLIRKLEGVEEALTQTQDILKAKALVLLTDQAVAARTNLPQEPAWTGDDTLKVSQAANETKATSSDSNSPVSNITSSLKSPSKLPSLFVVSIVTAIIAGAAAFGAIALIQDIGSKDLKENLKEERDPQSSAPSSAPSSGPVSTAPAASRQDQLMAEAAKIANQIEPGGQTASAPLDSLDQSQSRQSTELEKSQAVRSPQDLAQDKAVEDFKATAPTEPLSARLKPDKSLPKPIANIESQAFAGDMFAQHDLAAIYTAGHAGVKVDYARAAKWFEESAHNGSSNAQYNLGVLYHQGLGVRKDTAKAIELYRVAASHDHPEALYNLAIAYVEGVGVEFNPQIAATYFERSADLGVVEAAYNLGLLQEDGLLGESQPDEAIFWYKLAADKGHSEAVKSLADLQRKLSMTDDDVTRLTRKIAATKPGYLDADGKPGLPDSKKPDEALALERQTVKEDQSLNPNSAKSKTVAGPDLKPDLSGPGEKNLSPKVDKKAVNPLNSVDPVIISQIQEQLIRLGLYKGTPNGLMSPHLVESIKTYQSRSGLKIDGNATDDLLVQMLASGVNEVSEEKQIASPENDTDQDAIRNVSGADLNH